MAITTDIDKIRLEIGATDATASVTLFDDEITYALTQEDNFWGAAARCAEMLSMKYMQKADVRLGHSLWVQYTKLAEQYAAQAARLRQKALGTRVPWVGGMDLADKQTYEEDLSIVQPAFARKMMENPWAGGYTSDVDDSQADPSTPVSEG